MSASARVNQMPSSTLTEAAAQELRDLLRWSLWSEVIGPEVFLARIAALRDMCSPDSGVGRYCRTLLGAEEWLDDSPEWGEDDDPQSRAPLSAHEEDGPSVVWDGDDEDALIVQFIPAASTGLQDWYFRKGDPDPFPSVPHGHGRRDSHRKLDPYQGYITRKGNQLGRVPRRNTVLLWNDAQFRQFAWEAIKHFVSTNPRWNWGSRNPLRLPIRQRP